MVFVETTIFTQNVTDLLEDESYRLLQSYLARNPNAGSLIRHGGGLRKVRWAIPGGGKSGGLRIIYYWANSRDQILMLYIYAKNERDDLTDKQRDALRQVIRESYP